MCMERLEVSRPDRERSVVGCIILLVARGFPCSVPKRSN